MLNNVHYRTSRNKVPVYTSDKRVKFTQRENKKWIRLATVFGYIVAVSTPAIILSIYYIFFWNPDYLSKFPAPLNVTVTPTVPHSRQSRGLDPEEHVLPIPPTATEPPQCQPCDCKEKPPSGKDEKDELYKILAAGIGNAKEGKDVKLKPDETENVSKKL